MKTKVTKTVETFFNELEVNGNFASDYLSIDDFSNIRNTNDLYAVLENAVFFQYGNIYILHRCR